MAKRIFTREIREYIFSEIDRRGFVEVDEVAEIIKGLHVYDPLTAEDQWYRDKARRLMASRKDSNGVRVLFATGPASGTYIGAETGNRAGKITPEKAWVDNIVEAADLTHTAVFMKDSLKPIVGWMNMRRELPWD